ncbi:MAG: hypothetical protein ACI310_00400 [Bacilli bacterium]
MAKLMFTTVYDNVLSKIETMTRDNVDIDTFRNIKHIKVKDKIIDKKYGVVDISLINENLFSQYSKSITTLEATRNLANQILVQMVLLTAQDIMIYRILLSHYINYQQNGIATITLDKIHNEYRGKTFMYKKGSERYDRETLQAYIRSFRKLRMLTINIRFSESKLKSFKSFKDKDKTFFQHKMLIFHNQISIANVSDVEIKYSLGDFGTYICNSRQYGQLLPQEMYQLRFNQIDTFNLAMYIARMIVINRRCRKEITIYVGTLLSRINKYDMKGYSTSYTYLKYLEDLEPVKRNKKIKHIEEQLNIILDMLVKEHRIKKYEYIGKFNYKFIKAEELALKIYLNKQR